MALDDYARAADLKPDYLQAFYNRGVVLARLGRHREAVADFDRVVVLNPGLSNGYLNRGASLDELGQHLEAVGDYTEALRCNPDNADAHCCGSTWAKCCKWRRTDIFGRLNTV